MRKFCGGANRVERKAQFPRQNVGCPSRQQAERNLAAGETVNHFVDGAIAATSQDHVSAVRDRGLSQLVSHGGPRRGRQLDFQARLRATRRRLDGLRAPARQDAAPQPDYK